jgi:hypothetical protein
VLDTKEDPRQPKLVKVLGAEELAKHAGYSRPPGLVQLDKMWAAVLIGAGVATVIQAT